MEEKSFEMNQFMQGFRGFVQKIERKCRAFESIDQEIERLTSGRVLPPEEARQFHAKLKKSGYYERRDQAFEAMKHLSEKLRILKHQMRELGKISAPRHRGEKLAPSASALRERGALPHAPVASKQTPIASKKVKRKAPLGLKRTISMVGKGFL